MPSNASLTKEYSSVFANPDFLIMVTKNTQMLLKYEEFFSFEVPKQIKNRLILLL